MRGIPPTEEAKRALSAKRSEAARARWTNPEFRERALAKMREVARTPQGRKNRSDVNKRYWLEHRDERMVSVAKGIEKRSANPLFLQRVRDWHRSRRGKPWPIRNPQEKSRKISEFLCAFYKTERGREARRKSAIGLSAAWSNPEYRARVGAKISATQIGRPMSEVQRLRHSQVQKECYLDGRRLGGPQRHRYNGFLFRSQYEVQFATQCDVLKICWVYEPKRFALPSGTFTPDFFLPEQNLWIDVKGKATNSSIVRNKKSFGIEYPRETLVVVKAAQIESFLSKLVIYAQ